MNRLLLVIVSFSFLFQIHTSIAGNYKIIVKVNEQECLGCFMAHLAFDKFDSDIEKTLLFKSFDSKTIDRYLKINFPINTEQVSIISSDSIYNQYKSDLKSELFFFEDNKKLLSFKMRDIWKNIAIINQYTENTDTSIELKNNISFFAGKIIMHNEFILVFDPMLQIIEVFDTLGNSQQIIEYSDLNVMKLLKTIPNSDTVLYKKFRQNIVDMGFKELRFVHFISYNNSLYISAQLTSPRLNNKDSLNLQVTLYKVQIIIELDILDELTIKRILYVDENTLPHNYYVDLNGFAIQGNSIVCPVYKFNIDNKVNNCIGSFSFDENGNSSLRFESFINYELPEIFTKNLPDNFYSNLQPMINPEVIYFNYSNSFYLIDNGTIVPTPFVNENIVVDFDNIEIHYDYMIHDIYYDKSKLLIHIIYADKDGNLFFAMKKISERSYNTTKLEYPSISNAKSFILFKGFREIWYLSKDNTIEIHKLKD